MSNDISWALFSFALPLHCFPLSYLLQALHSVVVLFGLVMTLLFLTVLKWHLFPPHKQLLAVVGISMSVVYILNKKI
jgi:uncharacterized membrane protein